MKRNQYFEILFGLLVNKKITRELHDSMMGLVDYFCEEEVKPKIQYYPEGDYYWTYMVGETCVSCGSNCQHLMYHKKDHKIEFRCNGCNLVIGEMRNESVDEYLEKGLWK